MALWSGEIATRAATRRQECILIFTTKVSGTGCTAPLRLNDARGRWGKTRTSLPRLTGKADRLHGRYGLDNLLLPDYRQNAVVEPGA